MTKLALLLSLPAIAMSQNSCRYFPQLGNICARNRVKATRDYGVPSIFFNKLRYRKNTQGTVTSVKGSKVYIKWDNCRNCLNDGAAYWTEPKNGNIKRVGHISPVPGPSPTSCRRGARAKVTNTLAWANRHQIHDHVELLKLVTTARCRTRKAWEVMNLDQSQPALYCETHLSCSGRGAGLQSTPNKRKQRQLRGKGRVVSADDNNANKRKLSPASGQVLGDYNNANERKLTPYTTYGPLSRHLGTEHRKIWRNFRNDKDQEHNDGDRRLFWKYVDFLDANFRVDSNEQH